MSHFPYFSPGDIFSEFNNGSIFTEQKKIGNPLGILNYTLSKKNNPTKNFSVSLYMVYRPDNQPLSVNYIKELTTTVNAYRPSDIDTDDASNSIG